MCNKPDWKNEEHYSYTKGLDNEGWAWEFLRRYSKYRSDYEEYKNLWEIQVEKHGDLDLREASFLGNEIPHKCFYIPEREPNEELDQWIDRAMKQGKYPRRLTPAAWCAHLWGISVALDPDNYGKHPTFTSMSIFPALVSPYAEMSEDPNAALMRGVFTDELETYLVNAGQGDLTDKLILCFSLSKPITPQVKQLKSMFKNFQRWKKDQNQLDEQASHNVQKIRLTNYLRVLDAVSAQASNTEIAEILVNASSGVNEYHGVKQIDDWMNAAQNLVANYKNLLTMPSEKQES